MNFSYQVEIDDVTGSWVAVTPKSPHGPCDSVHLGKYWHTTRQSAAAHAQKIVDDRSGLGVRIVRKDIDGRISVEQTVA